MVIFTIGHSNLPLESFIALLKQHNISTVVDVRSQPFSSYNPQFNQGNLANRLELNSINYKFLGDKLGGNLRHTKHLRVKSNQLYQEGIAELIQIAEQEQTVIMCSESDLENAIVTI